ncbi:MAG TPA: hypothetical protein VGL48_07780 [Acidimicrobiales bacterium]|jgi:hypothetical protein
MKLLDHIHERAEDRRRAEQARQEAAAQQEVDHRKVQLANDRAVLLGKIRVECSLVLHAGERAVGIVTNVGLVEIHRAPGHQRGSSSGVSVPLPFTRIRVRTGGSRGHFVQGPLRPQIVDTGTLTITNQRLVFHGSTKVADLHWDKLVGIDYQLGEVNVAISNRTTTTVLHHGPAIDPWVRGRLLVLALFRGEEA